MFSDVRSVWDWLLQQTDHKLFYVQLLHVRTPEQLSRFLSYLVPLAHALQSNPEIVRSLIQGELGGWRSSVIGASVAILQVQSDFETDIADQIIRGNWIAPQLAAGFAIISKGAAVPGLEAFLATAQINPRPESLLVHPKGFLSAYAALKLIDRTSASEFRASGAFAELCEMDRDDCVGRAEGWFNAWKDAPSF